MMTRPSAPSRERASRSGLRLMVRPSFSRRASRRSLLPGASSPVMIAIRRRLTREVAWVVVLSSCACRLSSTNISFTAKAPDQSLKRRQTLPPRYALSSAMSDNLSAIDRQAQALLAQRRHRGRLGCGGRLWHLHIRCCVLVEAFRYAQAPRGGAAFDFGAPFHGVPIGREDVNTAGEHFDAVAARFVYIEKETLSPRMLGRAELDVDVVLHEDVCCA